MNEGSYVRNSAILILSALLIFTVSCQKGEITAPLIITPQNNINGFEITGDGYLLKLFTMNKLSENSGAYDTSKHKTFIVANGDTDSMKVNVVLNFTGNSSYSPANIMSPDTINISITNTNTQKTLSLGSVPEKSVLKITRYNGVGGRIDGLFNGPFVNLSDLTDTVKISNGRFSVVRLQDTH